MYVTGGNLQDSRLLLRVWRAVNMAMFTAVTQLAVYCCNKCKKNLTV